MPPPTPSKVRKIFYQCISLKEGRKKKGNIHPLTGHEVVDSPRQLSKKKKIEEKVPNFVNDPQPRDIRLPGWDRMLRKTSKKTSEISRVRKKKKGKTPLFPERGGWDDPIGESCKSKKRPVNGGLL